MSTDALVYDMSSSSRQDPAVFVKKDWLSINDDMNQNYNGNQITIQTSQLSNSNKYMDYHQAYLQIPLLLTLTNNTPAVGALAPATAATSCDYALGLKNWIGTIFHNFTIEYNGTTIAQQTNYLPIYNCFKLMTTLSWADTQSWSSIGFYPDNALSVSFQTANSENGIGVANNQNALSFPVVTGAFNSYDAANTGLLKRQMYFNYDPQGSSGAGVANTAAYSTLLGSTYANQLYKSYIFTQQNSTAALHGVYQQAIVATCYLKHLADFFEQIPLLKGVFLKMTFGISNTSVAFTVAAANVVQNTVVTNALGGVQPLMISSALAGNGSNSLPQDGYIASLCVGGKCLNTTQAAIAGVVNSPLQQSVTLNVPAYTFAPQMEIAYLSNPVRRISFRDLYQFTIQNVASGSQMNSLISNGIANMKKVVCVPFFTANGNGGGLHQIQSPFDSAGSGTSAPFAHLGGFNIVVSGANAFLNSVKYTYEMFNNNVYGCNSLNGGLTDGLGSSLINSLEWETAYCYYVGDVSRALDVEKDVPKSLSIVGQNLSGKEIDLFVFVEYGTEIVVDILTGARV